MSHLEIHNMLTDMQFGFQKCSSAGIQLLQTKYNLQLACDLNHKSQTAVILLDFNNTFNIFCSDLILIVRL